MDALRMIAVDRLSTARDSDYLVDVETDEICLVPRMKAALGALLEALEYSQGLGTSAWDFATEVSGLRRLKLSNADMRWLVVRGFVEHALEVSPRHDVKRSFRQSERLVFGKKSCFVLTPCGAAVARELRDSIESLDRVESHDSAESREKGAGPLENSGSRACAHRASLDVASMSPSPPKWDRDRQELRIGAIVVKRFTIPSASQETILAAFEEKHWPERIDDPLPPGGEPARKARLQETINLLNRAQRRPLVRFLGDSSGQAILWEYCVEQTAAGR